MTRKLLLVTVVIASTLASLGTFAYAATLNHQVNVRHFQGVSGGFYDDTGLWSIVPDPFILGGTGLIVYPIDRAPLGTVITSPVVMTAGGFNPVTDGVTAGAWVLRLAVTNTSAIKPSTTWALRLQNGSPGGISTSVTFYFATPAILTSGGYTLTVITEIGTNTVQNLQAPLEYTVVVENT